MIRLVSGVVGLIGATLLFWLGIIYCTYLPAGWPNYPRFGPWAFHLPWAGELQAERSKYAALLTAVKAANARALQIQTRQAAVSSTIGAQQQVTQTRIRTVTRTIIQEIPRYVTVKADAGCTVPLGFVQLHNAAASGDLTLVPDSPPGVVDAPSGVALDTVADAIAANYGLCRANAAELSGWQSWYAQQRAASK